MLLDASAGGVEVEDLVDFEGVTPSSVATSQELVRANDELIKFVACFRSKQVDTFSRGALLKMQTELAMLVSRIGEAQRLVSICMFQHGKGPKLDRVASERPGNPTDASKRLGAAPEIVPAAELLIESPQH